MDKKGNKVEKYKITEEQRNFQKKFKKLTKLRDLLTSRSLILSQAQVSTQKMLRDVAQGMSKLKIPKEGTRDLPGMDFAGTEEDVVQGNPENLQLF